MLVITGSFVSKPITQQVFFAFVNFRSKSLECLFYILLLVSIV